MIIPVFNGAPPLLASKLSVVAREDYRPDIDGLRAIAALAVVGTHAGAHAGVLPGGFIGVDIFFVISGYLITGLILRALARRSFSTLEFYARRVKRIFPALIALLTAASALGWITLLSDDYRQLGREIAEGAGFVFNLQQYWHSDSAAFHTLSFRIDLSHLWSLGVEEQFYLLWPLFLILIWKLKKGQFIFLAGITALSFVINVVMVSRGIPAAYPPWARLWELSLGGAFAYMQSCRPAELARLQAVFSRRPLAWFGLHNHHVRGLIGAALTVGLCVWLKYSRVYYPGWWALAPTMGALLIISAGTTGCVNRYVLGTTPLVSIGLISYPLYLWHYILLDIPHLIWSNVTPLMTIAAVVGAFLLSFITYRYIELPIRHSSNIAVVAGALCTVMLGCGILGYVMYRGGVPTRYAPDDVQKFVRASMEDWLPGTSGTSWTPASNKLIIPGTGLRSVLYIGDSNMQQYYPRIAKILADHPLNSRSAVFAARDWCAPFESNIPDSNGATSQVCRDFVRDAFEYAKGPTIDTVVIGACWRCYLLSFDDLLGRSGTVNTGADQALDSLQRKIGGLVLAGKCVYVVLGIPVGFDLDPRTMIRPIILSPGFRLVIQSPKRIELANSFEPIRSRLVQIAKATGANIIDPMRSLCGETMCPPVSPQGEPVYHDWFDLSPSYVRENVRFLDRTILDP